MKNQETKESGEGMEEESRPGEAPETYLPRSNMFKEDYSPARIHLGPLCDAINNQSSSGQPGFPIVVQSP